jgi:molecular chaperone GrpE
MTNNDQPSGDDAVSFDDPVPLFDVAALQADLDKAQRQIADYKTLIADFDNSRKRLIQDAERQRKYAHEPLARDILAMFDNLDRALAEAKKAGDDGPLAKGVAATVSLAGDILKRHGITKIETAPGSAFDPNQHQAVMQQPAPEGIAPGAVVQVLQLGFLLHDRVLRPASVIVASEG